MRTFAYLCINGLDSYGCTSKKPDSSPGASNPESDESDMIRPDSYPIHKIRRILTVPYTNTTVSRELGTDGYAVQKSALSIL